MNSHGIRRVLSAVLGVAGVSAMAAGASFAPLGIPPQLTFSQALRLSTNGTVVVGYAGLAGTDYAFHRTLTDPATGAGAYTLIEPTAPANSALANGVSGDGAVVVGRETAGSSATTAWRWSQAEGKQPLGSLAGWTQSFAVCANMDGSVIAGNVSTGSGQRGFRWVNGTLQQINPVAGFNAVAVTAVSSDGSLLTGYFQASTLIDRFRWCQWTSGGGAELLPYADGDNYAIANSANADGSAVVGVGGVWGVQGGPIFWSKATGTERLPMNAGWSIGQAHAVSGDGLIVVGSIQIGTALRAVLWDRSSGAVHDLNTLLPGRGVSLNGFTLEHARGISDDGTIIAGFGRTSAAARDSWVVVLPRSCPGDANGDMLINAADLSVLLSNFGRPAAGPSSGDFNGDGACNAADLSVLLSQFGQGC